MFFIMDMEVTSLDALANVVSVTGGGIQIANTTAEDISGRMIITHDDVGVAYDIVPEHQQPRKLLRRGTKAGPRGTQPLHVAADS